MVATKKKAKKSNVTRKSTSPDTMRSFRLYPNEKPFFRIRISQQTFYWLIIGILVLALGMWTLFLSIKIQYIYDQLHLTSTINEL